MITMLSLIAPLASAHPPAPPSPPPPPAPPEMSMSDDRGRGLGLGFDGGWVGTHYASGLRLDVPLVGQRFGLRLRTTTAYTDPAEVDGFSPTNGGALEMWARSPVMGDVVRFYGGGGPHVAIDHTHELAIGGGGHFGLELLPLRKLGITVELGRHWGHGALAATRGASLMGGVVIYLGRQDG